MPANFVMEISRRADGSECAAISYKGQPVAALWTDAEAPVLDVCSVDRREGGDIVWSRVLGTVPLRSAPAAPAADDKDG